MRAPRKMRLGAFLQPSGHHIAAWRDPSAQADSESNIAHYIELARTASRGLFDMLFLADTIAVRDRDPRPLSRVTGYAAHFEPLTLLSVLSAVTGHIGLVATATTTYNEPYQVARLFASLDLLSGGRAGWNLVTSSSAEEAFNFGRTAHVEHGLRYERAAEFESVVKGLWQSWEDDAFLHDKPGGRHFDPAKLHALNHVGRFFSVKGPLNVARSPQGQPVVVQAGSSGPGRDLAARTADVIFTVAPSIEVGQGFYSDMKSRVAAAGRNPDHVLIMPGVSCVVGRTRAEAEDKLAALQALVQPEVGLWLLGTLFGGLDLSAYPLDEPLPDLPETNAEKGRMKVLTDMASKDGLTLRQLYLRNAPSRGHCLLVGSASDIADGLEAWLNNGAADGFNILPPTLPGGLNDFVELVIPELQRRGLFRTAYEARTLRGNLGLPIPVNRRTDAS